MSEASRDPKATARALSRGLAAQRAAWQRALASGMPRAGWKIGLNVPEVQERLGLDGPLVGWLDGRRVLASGAEHAAPSAARLHVEAELALRVGAPLSASVSPDEARRAIREVYPALELVDYALPRDGLEAIVAHSMFHAATVLGPPSPFAGSLPGAGLPRVSIGGEVRAAAQPGWVPPDLGGAVALVARRLEALGETLQPGDLVLSGSYTTPLPLERGEIARADFGALGDVSISRAR